MEIFCGLPQLPLVNARIVPQITPRQLPHPLQFIIRQSFYNFPLRNLRYWPFRPINNKQINTGKKEPAKTTERGAGWCSSDDLNSYSVGSWFETQLRHRLSWPSSFVVFLSPSRQILGQYLDWATDTSFQILLNSCFSHPTILATDSIVKLSVKETEQNSSWETNRRESPLIGNKWI
jgi:hypothetical protein